MIYFTAHTFKCVCHCRRAMFRVLGMYNFGVSVKLHNPKIVISMLDAQLSPARPVSKLTPPPISC